MKDLFEINMYFANVVSHTWYKRLMVFSLAPVRKAIIDIDNMTVILLANTYIKGRTHQFIADTTGNTVE